MLDLLDTPYEHYWQDVAKLHQDLAGGWYRRRSAPISQYVLDYMRHRLRETVRALDPRYDQVHAVLMAVVFARILPYVRTDAERAFVSARVRFFAEQAAVAAE